MESVARNLLQVWKRLTNLVKVSIIMCDGVYITYFSAIEAT